jgi:endoglucanase
VLKTWVVASAVLAIVGSCFTSTPSSLCSAVSGINTNTLGPYLPTTGPPVQPLPALPLHTEGSTIYDAQHNILKIAAVNWYGAEEADFVPGGLDKQPLDTIAAEIRQAGFNAVRLPWSNFLLECNPTIVPNAMNVCPAVAANSSLCGHPAMDVFDATTNALANQGLMIILDNHTTDPQWCCRPGDRNELWWQSVENQDDFPTGEKHWLDDWNTIAKRFESQPAVVGADLRNEPRGATEWVSASVKYNWSAAATEAGNSILSITRDRPLLIFVEGTNSASDLTGAYRNGISLDSPGHLVYEAHVYSHFGYCPANDQSQCLTPTREWGTPDDWGTVSYDALARDLDSQWGFLAERESGAVPVWVGEFGTQDACEPWFSLIRTYLADRHFGWAYWPLNGTPSEGGAQSHNVETWGLLNSDWNAMNHPLVDALQSLQGTVPPEPNGNDGCASDRILFATGPPQAEPQVFNEMTPDGTDIRQLPIGAPPYYAPALSPDGTKLVLDQNGQALAVANADGTSVQIIWPPSGAEVAPFSVDEPAWSPSSDQIAFVYSPSTSEAREIEVVNADGSGFRQVVKSVEVSPAGGLAWSPDGSELAFASSSGGIDAVAASGGEVRTVLENQSAGEVTGLSWAPGPSLLFATSSGPGIQQVQGDGSGLETLLPGTGYSSPSWGPNGHFLAVLDGRVVVAIIRGGLVVENAIGPTGVDYAQWGGPYEPTASPTSSPPPTEVRGPAADVVRSFFAKLGRDDFVGAADLVLPGQRSCFLGDYTTFPVHVTVTSVQVVSVNQTGPTSATVQVRLSGHAETPFGSPPYPSGAMKAAAVGGTWYVDYEHSIVFEPPCLA